jgi:hypothetical protein
MLGILEPMAIKCVFPLIPRDIVDNYLLSYRGALIGVWLSVGLVLELEVIFIWERERKERLTRRSRGLVEIHHRGLGSSLTLWRRHV